jgi:hypothetical protein
MKSKVSSPSREKKLDFATATVYGYRYMRTETNALTREILLAFWKVHILQHAAEGPVYGQWMMSELHRHGCEISSRLH